MNGGDPREAEKLIESLLTNKQYFVDLNIDSPKALALAIAERASVALGVKVSAVNEGGKSTVVFKPGAVFNKAGVLHDLGPAAVDDFLKAYRNSLADLGGYYGYVTRVASVQPEFAVNFTKTF